MIFEIQFNSEFAYLLEERRDKALSQSATLAESSGLLRHRSRWDHRPVGKLEAMKNQGSEEDVRHEQRDEPYHHCGSDNHRRPLLTVYALHTPTL